jgi:hypothetical protein
MTFANGDGCNGQIRVTTAVMRCDKAMRQSEWRIHAVGEPQMCHYRAILASRLACRAGINAGPEAELFISNQQVVLSAANVGPVREMWFLELSEVVGGGMECSVRNGDQDSSVGGSQITFSTWTLKATCNGAPCRTSEHLAFASDGSINHVDHTDGGLLGKDRSLEYARIVIEG